MGQIAKYELFLVPPRWLFLRIETKDGRVGWGEPILEGRATTVAAAVRELMEKYVMTANIDRIEDVWATLYRGGFYRGGPVLMSAISGIDQALWDLKGKRFNAPVYSLIGGACRDRIRVYRWVGGDEPDELAEAARKCIADGFTCIKTNVAGKVRPIETPRIIERIGRRLAELRECVGPDIDIAVDFHGRVSASLAPRVAKAIEPIMPLFIEEPVPPEEWRALLYLKSQTSTPIALGERLYSRWEFRKYLEAGIVDILQPDLSHAGGITECKKIASLAETYGSLVAFHCPLGPIALAACLQVAATVTNYLIQETSFGIHYNEGIELTDYLENPETLLIKDGYIDLPKGPGLGIEIDEKAVRDASLRGHSWKNPVWRFEDGSLAEW